MHVSRQSHLKEPYPFLLWAPNWNCWLTRVCLSGLRWGCWELWFQSILKGRKDVILLSADQGGWMWMDARSRLLFSSWILLTPWAEMGWVWSQLVRVRALFSEPSFSISGNTGRMSSERCLPAIGFNGRRWGLPPTLTWRTIQMQEVGSNQPPSWVHRWLKGLWATLLVQGLHSHNWPVWLVISQKAKPAAPWRRHSCRISMRTRGSECRLEGAPGKPGFLHNCIPLHFAE